MEFSLCFSNLFTFLVCITLFSCFYFYITTTHTNTQLISINTHKTCFFTYISYIYTYESDNMRTLGVVIPR